MTLLVGVRTRQLGSKVIVQAPAVLMKLYTDPRDALAGQDDLVVYTKMYNAVTIWRPKERPESMVRLFVVWIGWIEVDDLLV